MKERDVEAALETAREVFAGELKIDECIEYIRALLATPKRRLPVGRVQMVKVTEVEGQPFPKVEIGGTWDPSLAQNLKAGDCLYTDPPLLSDSEFKDYLHRARTLMNNSHGTIELAIFLRDFETAVRGEK